MSDVPAPGPRDPHRGTSAKAWRQYCIGMLILGIFEGVGALAFFAAFGLTSAVLLLFLLAVTLVAIAVRRLKGSSVLPEAPSRIRARDRLLLLAAVLFAYPAWLLLNHANINGTPLLAGAAIGRVEAASSPVAGSSVARSGHRFVVIDAEVRSRLGALVFEGYHYLFHLEAEGQELDRAISPSNFVPNRCGGVKIPRWGLHSCRVVFEVPESAATARLRLDHGVRAWSRELDLRALPQADVPRVDLRARVRATENHPYSPEREQIEVLVQVTPRAGAAPVEIQRFPLEAPDESWLAFDRSAELDLEQPCTGTIFAARGWCVAVFDVPRDATVGRLTVRTFRDVLPGAEVAAGVTTVEF